jgi:hypothetical protein
MPPVSIDSELANGGAHEFRCYHPIPVGTPDAELIADAQRRG